MNNKILIVDDEESIRYTFQSFLSDEGHDVTTASNFHEAIQLISETNFDLIFADIILGGKTGIDLLNEIKRANHSCPVVMITGSPNIDTASDAIRLGAFDYIAKPVRPDTLINTATIALEHKALEDENKNYRSNLEAIFSSVKDAIITIDKNFKILEVNHAANDICDIDRKCIGKTLNELSKKCSKKCFDIFKDTIQTKQTVETNRIQCNMQGHDWQTVTITTSPLITPQGQFSGAVMVIRDETRLNDLERSLKERQQFSNLIGKNETMQNIYALIEDLASVETTVLITGESGTGKELVADAIHYSGNRNNNLLVKVNCSALTESLLESELFGHVKGAFTGADRDKTGRFQKADGGTIFLDEIGDISQRMQLRLLRVIQEKVLERVGDSTPLKVDIRVIAATNQDLSKKVKLGQFRNDLYYRLKVVEVALPALRDRKDDIPLLVEHYLKVLNNKLNKNIEAVTNSVMEIFMNYDWPGNVRELENALEHAFILCHQNMISNNHLPKELRGLSNEITPSLTDSEAESTAIVEALRRAGWNKSKAARLLGITVRTVYRKIEKYNIKPEEI
jgi:PAS domain S-box-containing protein